jgi:hypothetical protein
VPEKTEVVIIAGPQQPFQAEEVARLQSYVARGGHLLLFLDNSRPTGLEEWLRANRVELGQGVIVDPLYKVQRPEMVLAPIFVDQKHPIVAPLQRQVVLTRLASPLVIPTGPAAAGLDPGIVATPILKTSPESWAEADPKDPQGLKKDPGRDTPGPLIVGIAVTGAPREKGAEPVPRMVVFGSRFLGDNGAVATMPTNLDVIQNAIFWLRGRPENLGVAPKTHVALTLTADPNLRAKLVLLPTLMAVAVLIGLGVFMYVTRRD